MSVAAILALTLTLTLASAGWSPLPAQEKAEPPKGETPKAETPKAETPKGETPKAETPFPAKVSANGRYLLDQNGRPFFWLGDTAWELFHRLDRDEADLYLRDRAAKGFNVIQAVVLAEYGGLTEPNREGHRPLTDNDPTKPVEEYFRHVDWVVDRAASLGMAVGMLPTWGDKWNKKWGEGPEIFTPESALAFGEFLGKRYKDKPIVWILGGDRPIESPAHLNIIRAFALGLHKADGGRHLTTFHPNGGRSSADWLHSEVWLDFNMLQSGHEFNRANYDRVGLDFARRPPKPCLDAEPGYEDHPSAFKKENGYLGEHDVRKFAYWAVFSGACGHTYGCHDIWQFYTADRKPITFARTPWKEALNLPGAGQMRHLRALMESRPVGARVPSPTLLLSPEGAGADRVQACRSSDGAYGMVYIPNGKPVTVNLSRLSGTKVIAHWYDPRTGAVLPAGEVATSEGKHEFAPPAGADGKSPDWVLVLDDADRKFPAPGKPLPPDAQVTAPVPMPPPMPMPGPAPK
jgi:hypothetical protein